MLKECLIYIKYVRGILQRIIRRFSPEVDYEFRISQTLFLLAWLAAVKAFSADKHKLQRKESETARKQRRIYNVSRIHAKSFIKNTSRNLAEKAATERFEVFPFLFVSINRSMNVKAIFQQINTKWNQNTAGEDRLGLLRDRVDKLHFFKTIERLNPIKAFKM